jgi:gamma-glutamyl:cysteine ligase YbdK (ATP-grasp superfamily)
MGLAIDREEFSSADYDAFSARLTESLTALETLLRKPAFGNGPLTVGAELELCIVDADGAALPLNRQVFRSAGDRRLQLELDRFNLEYNFDPAPLAGQPFADLRRQLRDALGALEPVARKHGGRIVYVGILPTLVESDVQPSAMTHLPRYRVLAAGIKHLRGGAPFEVDITGHERLTTTCEGVTLEGAATSFQLHLRVPPGEFANTFNAAQMVTPIAMAIAANSPVFLGRLLWDETRIALFKQAIDARTPDRKEWRRAARVPFGHGWVRNSALELFAESIALFPPLIPIVSDEAPVRIVAEGRTPGLWELRLHQSTIWQWNRAIFDPADNGHLRIELRALPAGPTIVDMAANAAFLFGLILGIRKDIRPLLAGFPFHYAEYNFYRAAQQGLDAELLWPRRTYPSPYAISARELVVDMLPVAERGLAGAGVHAGDIEASLEPIRRRLATGMTGAHWQRTMVQKLEQRQTRPDALHGMLAEYMRHMTGGRPVGDWPTKCPEAT